jgi:polar amino acid transport system substrate-binding protein
MRTQRIVASVISFLLLAAATPATTVQASAAHPTLNVGIKEAPPFAMKLADGSWGGISVDLWQSVAEDLGLDYTYRERDLAGLFDGLVSGDLDVSIGALTVTAAREERIDFTHPFHSSGLGIAVAKARSNLVAALVRRVFSREALAAFGGLAAFLFLGAFFLWLFERRKNGADFGGRAIDGLGNAFWWSAVTMTTVGYGDKVPRTRGGRVVGMIWMFTGVITISAFTASIASVLTLSQLEGAVRGPSDLPSVRVATIDASTSAQYLEDKHVPYRGYRNPRGALDTVAAGDSDAVVYDAPILRYLVKTHYTDRLRVLPSTFDRQSYAFALRPGSKLRERVNRAILERIAEPAWQDTLYRYLGQQP